MNKSIYIKGFKSYLQLERGLSHNTIDAYIHDASLFMNFLDDYFPDITIKEVNIDILREFILRIDKMDLGAYTQARIISGIKAYYKYLVLERIVSSDPSDLIESPKLGRKLPDVLSVDEMDAIIESVDLSENEGERNKAILETLYGCGLRVSELINLQISNLHFDEGIMIVSGKGNKQRLVPVGGGAKKHLTIYLKGVRVHANVTKRDQDIVFLNRRGSRLTRQMIFYIVRKHVEKAGIHKNISPHSFRHSYATHLVQNGADLRVVQELLGHVSITTTEVYTHLNREDLRNAIIKYHPLNK